MNGRHVARPTPSEKTILSPRLKDLCCRSVYQEAITATTTNPTPEPINRSHGAQPESPRMTRTVAITVVLRATANATFRY
jgi:hypothetical protein